MWPFGDGSEINNIILPKNALTNKPPNLSIDEDSNSVKKVLYPPIQQCEHCKIQDAEYGCVLEKFNGEYSMTCDDALMFLSANPYSLARERRHTLYYFMALRCFYPMQLNEIRRLPRCVVADIQATFPDPDNAQARVEADVYFYRHATFRNQICMEFRTEPIYLPYPGQG